MQFTRTDEIKQGWACHVNNLRTRFLNGIVYIPAKIATDYDTNLPPEKLKAATQNEQNDGWLIVKNRTISAIHIVF